MKFVPCVAWIRRGVAKETPEKIALTKEEVKELLEGNTEDLLEDEEDEEETDEVEEDDGNQDKQTVEGASSIANEVYNEDTLGQYNLDSYDHDDDTAASSASGLKGLTCFSSNDIDPYMTLRDEEDESDIEDFQIRPDDNLIAFGIVDDDCNTVEFHVYNHDENQFFVHHDILLPTVPLCMEWLDFDADNEATSCGNYLAVGGMSPAIEVWDVDVVDCLEPIFVLGSSKKKKRKPKDVGHTDAVLDLAWNSRVRNVLASGSADHTVALWDMSNGKVISLLNHFSEKVQSLKWHPFEPQNLLIGSCDEMVTLIDCRDPHKVAKSWKCDGEVERVIWNNFDPFYCLASTDRGFVRCYDARVDDSLWTLSAHQKSCSGLCLSSQCPGLMVTASVDECIKVWDIVDHQPTFVHQTKLKLGKLYSMAESPDSPFVIAVGGDNRNHNYKLYNLMVNSAVQNRFKDRTLIQTSISHERKKAGPDDEGEITEMETEKSAFTMETLNLKDNDPPIKKETEEGKKKKKKKKRMDK